MSDKSLDFKTEDVTIAQDGRVIINNAEFAKRLVAHVKKVAPGSVGILDNCDCKDKAISDVNLGKVLPATTFKLDPGVVGIFDNCACKGRINPGGKISK